MDYLVWADLRFGSTKLPNDLIVVKKIKEMSDLKLELKTKKATSDSPFIKVKGHNAKLYID